MSIFSIKLFIRSHMLWAGIGLFYPFGLFAQQSDSLVKAIQKWDEQRMTDLKSENGWLNLAGLEWLKPGINKLGSGGDADIHFPSPSFPPSAGTLIWENNEVWYEPNPAVKVSDNGATIEERKRLWAEYAGNNSKLSYGSFRWFIIKRDNKLGVRIRDLEAPALRDFKGIDRFAVSLQWLIKARFVPEPKWSFRTVPIVNALGQTIQMKSPGRVIFSLAGQTYQVDAIEDGPDTILIVFGDPTNDVSTYASGRFLSFPLPAEGTSEVWLDFNKAYNPPCAFTPFATCPLPPPQNQIRVAVEAGEKLYKKTPEIK